MTSKTSCFLTLIVALSAPLPCAAQEPPSTARAAAHESAVKGVRFFTLAEKKHDRALYEAAYLQFIQAYAVLPEDRVLWNLTVCEIRTDRFLEGLEHLRLYDAHQHVLSKASHPDYTMFKELLEQANAATGHLALDAPDGALVSIDGKSVAGRAPIGEPVDVQPGDHVVTAQLGDKSTKLVVTATAGAKTAVHLAFAPDAPSPVVVPIVPISAATSTPPDQEQLSQSGVSTTGTVVRWSLTGVGIVGLGLGAVFGLEANSKANEVETFRASNAMGCGAPTSATCARTQSLIDDQSRATTLSYVFYGVGAVSAVGAVAAWLWWPRQQERSGNAAWIVPSVGPGIATMQVGGRF